VIKTLLIIELNRGRGWILAGAILAAFGMLLSIWIYYKSLGVLELNIGRLMGGAEGIQKEVMRFSSGLAGYVGWVMFFFSGLIFFQNTLSLLNMKKLRDPRFDIVRLSQVPWWLKLSGVYGLQILFGIVIVLTSWGLIAYCGIEKLDYSVQACGVILLAFTIYYCSYVMPFVCWWILGATIYRKLASKVTRLVFLAGFFFLSIWLLYQYVWVLTLTNFKVP